jgi:hypothetical protein
MKLTPSIFFISLLLTMIPAAGTAQSCTTAVCHAASPSESDVLAALPSSSNTNATVVVNIPSGTGSWTGALTYTVPAAVTNLTIQGNTAVNCTGTPGTSGYSCTASDNTIIEDNDTTNEHVFQITAGGVNSLLRITGLTIEGGSSSTAKNDGILIVSGPSHNFRMDHVHINATTYSFTASFMTRFFGDLAGVVDHSICDLGGGTTNCFGASVNINDTIGQGDGDWAAPSNWGSSEFIYYEDDVVNGGMMTDCDTGGRFVVRYTSLKNGTTGSATIHNHGTKTPGGRGRSCRAYEAYHNYLIGPSASSFAALGMAGGTALIWGNNLAGLYSRFAGVGASRNDGSETETNTPAGWGYCGTNLSGTGSAWDGNQNTATGYPCLDGIGRGQDVQALNGSASIATAKDSVTNSIAWPQNYLEPVYFFNNSVTGVGAEVNISDESTQFNRDVYEENSSFNGTSGTGTGLLSARPTSCTAGPGGTFGASPTGSYGVAYFATDANGGNGELYVCTSPNTWTGIYQPYAYPHPLDGGGSSAPPPPAGPGAPTNLTGVVH